MGGISVGCITVAVESECVCESCVPSTNLPTALSGLFSLYQSCILGTFIIVVIIIIIFFKPSQPVGYNIYECESCPNHDFNNGGELNHVCYNQGCPNHPE